MPDFPPKWIRCMLPLNCRPPSSWNFLYTLTLFKKKHGQIREFALYLPIKIPPSGVGFAYVEAYAEIPFCVPPLNSLYALIWFKTLSALGGSKKSFCALLCLMWFKNLPCINLVRRWLCLRRYKIPHMVQKKTTLWCPTVPYVVQIKAPSSVLPHEGGRRDVGWSMGIIADLLMCPSVPHVVK